MSANNPAGNSQSTGSEVILRPPSNTQHEPASIPSKHVSTPILNEPTTPSTPTPSPSKPVGSPLFGKPPPNVNKPSIQTPSTPIVPIGTVPPSQPIAPSTVSTPTPPLPPVHTPPTLPTLPPPSLPAPIPHTPTPIPPAPSHPITSPLPPRVQPVPPTRLSPVLVDVPSIGKYEEIEDNSSEIVGFDELNGFGLKVRTAVHLHAGLDATLSFPLAAGVALSYASAPLSKVLIKKDTAEALANPSLPPPLPYYLPLKSYYLNAMIDPSQSIHLDYLHRYSQKMSWKLYGVSSLFEKESTEIVGSLFYDKPNYNIHMRTATVNQWLGVSFLRRVTQAGKWYIGSEIFFSNKQKSGGFSAGTQYLDKTSPYRPQWTATVNTMGEITTTFTSAIVPSILTGSARYTFNTNNHESEVGLGLSYTPKDLPITVKARWDNNNRWGVLTTLKFAVGKVNLLLTAGISGGEQAKSPNYGAVLSVDF